MCIILYLFLHHIHRLSCSFFSFFFLHFFLLLPSEEIQWFHSFSWFLGLIFLNFPSLSAFPFTSRTWLWVGDCAAGQWARGQGQWISRNLKSSAIWLEDSLAFTSVIEKALTLSWAAQTSCPWPCNFLLNTFSSGVMLTRSWVTKKKSMTYLWSLITGAAIPSFSLKALTSALNSNTLFLLTPSALNLWIWFGWCI